MQKKYTDREDVDLIIAHVLHVSREQVLMHPEKILGYWDTARIIFLLHKRKNGVPFAYITGKKEFYGLNFLVNNHTLVPRPETELLVETAIKEIQTLQSNQIPTMLIDVGTGSGCIPISILVSLPSAIKTIAIDISNKALTVAKKNAAQYTVPITFFCGNILEPIKKNPKLLNNIQKIIITANLPYLTQEQIDSEPSIQHEPHSALYAPDQGIGLYKELFAQLQTLPISNGSLSVYCEIHTEQASPLRAYILSLFNTAQIQPYTDLAGHTRILHITI